MLHYHGTPLTPKAELDKLVGKNFCVSFNRPDNSQWCIQNAQSIMWDNGAFSVYTRGTTFDVSAYIVWLEDKLYGANWAVVPDVIGGSVQEQVKLHKAWTYPEHLSCYVWHMDQPIDWLVYLVQTYPRIAFGSSGKYWKVKSQEWKDRADEAWDAISKTSARPWVHMMRGLSVCGDRWPFASADSTNVARNFKNRGREKCPKEMVERIDAVQTPLYYGEKHDTE